MSSTYLLGAAFGVVVLVSVFLKIYFVYKFAKSIKLSTPVSIFICAVIADLATYATTSIQLGLVFPDANSGFVGSALKFMGVFLTTQIPIAIVERLLTVVDRRAHV